MAKGGFRQLQNGMKEQLQGYLKRERMIDGYLNRVIYRIYQNRQAQRWKTEGKSEFSDWIALDKAYADRKKKLFAAYPGRGTKMMIATGRLVGGVIGRNDKFGDHRKLVKGKRLEVAWTTPYAIYTEPVRPVNDWDPDQDQAMYDGLAEYLVKGLIRQVSSIGGD